MGSIKLQVFRVLVVTLILMIQSNVVGRHIGRIDNFGISVEI